ncbi:SLAP domain-containing protein [Ornithinibacillus sp. L9]|uniref:SLAP domain-containing protein n=1 Tax=Ornithinibacillus caprae TaxID=2678566 RepID=A0A6N8FEP6_9BACI|nr:SLAP domain-containing protein [Ornithinibacillus caprae]MUK88020.1 SLAP domain-containing protein [Ornithinibacillus caprae]
MQTLIFEPKWEKTIAPEDRRHIEEVFKLTTIAKEQEISFTPLQVATNHREELLVTVLIHNTGDTDYMFHQQPLTYSVGDNRIATHSFTIQHFTLKPKTSLPWTFIFPKETIKTTTHIQGGQLHY